MPTTGPRALDVIYLVDFLGLNMLLPVCLGLGSLYIIYVHLVPYELRRCDRSDINLLKLVLWFQRIAWNSHCRELDTLR